MTALPAAASAPRRARAGRLAAIVLVVAMLFAIGWSAPVQASTGRAEGFAVEQATSQILIGRVTLRYEPELADDAEALAARIPGWWSEIERPLARDVDDTIRITFVDHAGRVAESTGHSIALIPRGGALVRKTAAATPPRSRAASRGGGAARSSRRRRRSCSSALGPARRASRRTHTPCGTS